MVRLCYKPGMPRASKSMREGYVYHLTHRCHDRTFLLGYGRDRTAYVHWLREGVKRYGVSVYGYCVTSNHVHVVVHVDKANAIAQMMGLASGATAKQFNVRKGRNGAMWEHPYKCTLIQDGEHLFNCLCYVDLNMVRAGEVMHPVAWTWCGYHELMGQRKRYRLLDVERLLKCLRARSVDAFQKSYAEAITRRIASKALSRESYWTEALAVGSETFTRGLAGSYTHRRRLDWCKAASASTSPWVVRESQTAYSSISGSKIKAKPL